MGKVVWIEIQRHEVTIACEKVFGWDFAGIGRGSDDCMALAHTS